MSSLARSLATAALTLAGVASHAAPSASSASLQLCDAAPSMTATQQDRLLRFAAIVRRELDAAGARVALIARDGTNLQRFGRRYSHAGIALKAHPNGAWSVRQLYYACDERQPRLFDQGLAGFLFGTDNPTLGYISLVLLDGAKGDAIERTALDNERALRLLAATYSANAYAYGLQYQNCNQWVIELLAAAWGHFTEGEELRSRAQRWLAQQGYAPTPVDVGSHLLMAAAPFLPMVHLSDHPLDDRYALQLRTSLPDSIEAFVHAHAPETRRIELCHDKDRIVIHRGWETLAARCVAGNDDVVIELD